MRTRLYPPPSEVNAEIRHQKIAGYGQICGDFPIQGDIIGIHVIWPENPNATHMKPAGQSTREMQKRHHQRRMLILNAILVVGCLFFLLLGTFFGYIHKPVIFIGLIVGLFLVFNIVMSFLVNSGKNAKSIEGKFRRGAIAEESMGDVLDKLPGDNLVLHDVSSRFGNIDHIIISRTKGIILVETKSHHGEITAEGDNLLIDGRQPEKDFIRQTLNNCYWLKEWIKTNTGLEAWINCVIVFTNGFVTVRGKIKGVSVINAKYFSTYYERLPDNRTAALWEGRDRLNGLEV